MVTQSASLASLFSLDGRVALVTGASSGIGRHMAISLARAGARVVLMARRQAELDELKMTLEQESLSAATLAGDLSQREQITHLAAKARDCFGNVHILVNAAGVNLREPVANISLESWDTTLNLNLAVPFFLARELVPGMREDGYGRVINIASLQSYRAFPNGLPYGASKGGICQLTRAMAEAWSSDGIMCNAIAPGFFPTELTAPVFGNDAMAMKFAEQTAVGRNGALEDLTGATIFFAAPASGYITGQTLGIDGGFTAK
ncbi:MAG: SDR family oxidoreductase [Pseudomonadota bacterium]